MHLNHAHACTHAQLARASVCHKKRWWAVLFPRGFVSSLSCGLRGCAKQFFFFTESKQTLRTLILKRVRPFIAESHVHPQKYTCVYKDALIAGMKAHRLSGILFTNPLISHPGHGQWWSSQSVYVVFLSVAGQIDSVSRVHPHVPHLRPRPPRTISSTSSTLNVHVCVYPLVVFALPASCQRLI